MVISKPKDGLSSENLRELIKSLEQKKRRHHPYHQKWQKNYLTFWTKDSNSHLLTAWFITHCPKSSIYAKKFLKIRNFQMDWGSSPLICSAIGSLLIGLTGILPLIFIDKNYEGFQSFFLWNVNFWFLDSKWMKYVLAFGAGTLLGDAFLHLLPEAMNYPNWGYG